MSLFVQEAVLLLLTVACATNYLEGCVAFRMSVAYTLPVDSSAVIRLKTRLRVFNYVTQVEVAEKTTVIILTV